MHFLALFFDGFGERVVVLDDEERLDEDGLARARPLVQEAAHLVAPIRAHGQAVAAALFRHVAARQCVRMRPRDLLELPDDFLPQPLDRRADRVEARGRRVLDTPVGLERGLALCEQVFEGRERKEQVGKSGEREVGNRHGDARALRALDEEEEVEEILRRKRAPLRAEA